MSIVHIFYHLNDDDDERLPLGELDIHPDLLQLLDELGVIEIREESIRPRQLLRAYKLLRLRQSMGVNLAGAAVILDLLERIEALEEQIARLNSR
jgi:MerR family transcriptional regulator/heat shock protein HspR